MISSEKRFPLFGIMPWELKLAKHMEAGYLSAMRILVIEDDRETANYLVKALGEAGHVADSAYGDTGYELGEQERATTCSSSTGCCRSATAFR